MNAPELSAGFSEFGEELARLVRASPGASGAVLCDELGEAIDWVHDPARIAAVDIELCGAQIAQTMFQLDQNLRKLGVNSSVVIIEGERGHLLAAVLSGEQMVTLALAKAASLGPALRALELTKQRLAELLR